MKSSKSLDIEDKNSKSLAKKSDRLHQQKTLPEDDSKELNKLKEKTSFKEKDLSKKKSKKQSLYRAKSTSDIIMSAMQLAINYSLSKQVNLPFRDILTSDFYRVNIYVFPSSGSSVEQTPPHPYPDFSFEEYSPVAFRYFRDIFGIMPEDYMNSLCGNFFKQLSNSGASGSLFYISSDDLFVIKTVDSREAKFLQQLLPGYYMNLHQNPNTLLPKFFGSYHYKSIKHNFRVLVMNNLLPSDLTFCEKYDLKGSTYKRRASEKERAKAHPTLKDLDFIEKHPKGLLLDDQSYDVVISTLARDARVLQSFKIMDYSLLLGIHRLPIDPNTQKQTKDNQTQEQPQSPLQSHLQLDSNKESIYIISKNQSKTVELVNSSAGDVVGMRPDILSKELRGLNIRQNNQNEEEPFMLHGGIPAKDENGNDLLLFIGIIDILQNFRLAKKFEYQFKSFFQDGKTISVNKPSFYQDRFMEFCKNRVFRSENNPTRTKSIYDSKGFTYQLHRKYPTQRYDQQYLNNISLTSRGFIPSRSPNRQVNDKMPESCAEDIDQPLKVADNNIKKTQN